MQDVQQCCLFIGRDGPVPAGFTSIFNTADTRPGRWVRSTLRDWADRTVDRIVCHFFIEHLSQTEILILLRQCRRMLRSGGTLEILTPDLAVLGERYTAGEWAGPGIAGLGAQWITGRAEFLNTMLRGWDRRWLCDAEELARLADQAGLHAAERLAIEAEAELPLPADEVLSMRFAKPSTQHDPQALVSIIVPAFRPDYLAECLDSALAQTYRPLEIVIVDDSLDAEVERIGRDYAQRESCIHYTRNESQLGEARNLTQGIRLACGEFIKPLYDDDLLLPDCVEKLLAAYGRAPDTRLAIGRRDPIDESGQLLDSAMLGPPLADAACSLPGGAVIAEIAESGINKIGEPTVMLFRRADVLALPEPDVMSLFRRRFIGIGDIGLALNLLSRGDLAYVADSVARFRLHPGQNQRRPGFRNWVAKTWIYFREQAARLGLDKAAQHPLPDTDTDIVDRSVAADHAASAAGRAEQSRGPSDRSYHQWMMARSLGESDGTLMADIMAFQWTARPRIQLVLRCSPEQTALLAETLESLKFQFYRNCHVAVFSTLDEANPEPEFLPAFSWHAVANLDDSADAINAVVRERGCDWIVELPPGSVLDPLYLFRIAHQANVDGAGKDIHAYFTDDDQVDARQIRRRPRFKADFDPMTLLCTDALGPLIVSAKGWVDCGGAASDSTRPWYDLALRICDSLGEDAFAHISEPLISLPERLSDDGHARVCSAAVRRSVARRKMGGKVTVLTNDTWRVQHSALSQPSVTIAVPSVDKPEYLEQCIDAILTITAYADYEIVIVSAEDADPATKQAIARLLARSETPIRCIAGPSPLNAARFANIAASEAAGDYLLLLSDDVRITRPDWLNILVSHATQSRLGCVAPILVAAADDSIHHAGYLPGLGGFFSSPHQGQLRAGDPGYLNCLVVHRTVAAVSSECMLVRRADYLEAGGLDEANLAAAYADIDFCLRLTKLTGKPCTVVADVTLYRLGASVLDFVSSCPVEIAEAHAAKLRAQEVVLSRWFEELAASRFWSTHLGRNHTDARMETRIVPDWHTLPAELPRFMAFPVQSAQGTIRVSQPMRALKRAGKAQTCIFSPSADLPSIPLIHDIARHAPDAIVTHQFIGHATLMALRQWRRHLQQTFLVFSVDDLLTEMPTASSLRQGVPADARTCLSRALKYCDRLVVSTEFLADAYAHLASDTRVVPNRLERDVWLPLSSRRGTSRRPRVGWAGGTAHQGDLQLIAEVVAATATEVDWIFMGMCPDNVRPYVKEFHPFGDFERYPARLAALNLDIAVAPLEQIPFNRGKSNLRLLEYGALGIPVVCTDIDPYRDSPACKVANRPQAWLDALRARIDDPAAAQREGDAMREWVVRHYILEDHLDDWLQAHLPG